MECFRAIRLKLRLTWQIWTKGWCDAESWDFSLSVAPNILPRLKVYKEQHNCLFNRPEGGGSHTKEETLEILDKMIFAFECLCVKEDESFDGILLLEDKKEVEEWKRQNTEKSKKIQEGLELFGKYFREIWW